MFSYSQITPFPNKAIHLDDSRLPSTQSLSCLWDDMHVLLLVLSKSCYSQAKGLL